MRTTSAGGLHSVRECLLALLCVGGALAPLPALAATLGTIQVDPNRQVEGGFSAPGTQAWRLSLRQGRHYAVWGWSGEYVAVTVRAAGGQVLARFATVDDEGGHGASFRAPYTGLYAVAVACRVDGNPGQDCHTSYGLAAGQDCPGDRSSPCGIAVGQTLRGLQGRFVEDRDWFRVQLAAGHGYTARAADEGPNGVRVCVSFHDGRGAEVVLATCGSPGAASFTPPTSGLYFVEVRPGENAPPATYSLSLGR